MQRHPLRAIASSALMSAEFEFEADGRRKRVFSSGAGPGILLMYELPWMVKECVALLPR